MPDLVAYELEDIFKKYKNKIYGLALSITHNENDAEDILQNTFFKIIKNIKGFRGESSLSTWIYKIAYNETLMYLRKKRMRIVPLSSLRYSRENTNSGLFINWSKLPDEQLLDAEFKQRLDNTIREMPIKYRLPLVLHNVERLSIRDGSRVLGLKANSFKTRLHRAHNMVKVKITDYFKDKAEKETREDSRCGIWTRFVVDYATGNLDKRRESAFKKHIVDCRGCNSFLDAYKQAIKITNALQCQDLPAELKEKIKTFILKPHKKH